MPDCLSIPDSEVVYNCTNLWGLNCTNKLGFEPTTLWNITLRIQHFCSTDRRLFLIDGSHATPENAALTHDACKVFAGSSWTMYPTSDIWTRLQNWKFPLFQLVVSSPRPPLGLGVETFVLMHLMGDPIGTIKDLLQKLSKCEARANACFELRANSSGNETDRVWKSLAVIAISFDEWGGDNGSNALRLLGHRLNELKTKLERDPDTGNLERFNAICNEASGALIADRATAFLPIWTAQALFIGAVAVAITKTASITATSSIFVNVEAHSIAFSSLYFWIIPAVFLSSAIGVSQTEGSIPRILKQLVDDPVLQGLGLPTLRNGDVKRRVVSGGVYSWQPATRGPDQSKTWYKSIWQFVEDRENWLPVFAVSSSAITAMLLSGYVPASGWQPRHCAYAAYLSVWIASFTLATCLKHPRPWLLRSSDFLSKKWSDLRARIGKNRNEQPTPVSDEDREIVVKYTMFRIMFLKDTIIALSTLVALLWVQVGPFNRCSSYTLWGFRGLALPGQPENAKILNQRIRTTYPTIAFISISIQVLLIPIMVVIFNWNALCVLCQNDDGTLPRPMRWLGAVRTRIAVLVGRIRRDRGEAPREMEVLIGQSLDLEEPRRDFSDSRESISRVRELKEAQGSVAYLANL
ncbi:uncharacterized protein PAC_17956 [Phialocephala subalpina]|uniref:Uncharacterized protein n=1 Tax=Phialocephala subalpina TaxID=576137 RepID=A0A1L7XSW1_9HELO|nr:uncharacterized protein PAC_17956 [Phialocephala subalpina]